jgi:predicted  nucleic acid-binding Zn-ribbon protein
VTLETRLRLLYTLQQIDASLDELIELKGDLPKIVAELQARLDEKTAELGRLEETMKTSLIRRDEIDLEIIALREKIERYKEQQFQIKTNRQYDALSREIDAAQERIVQLQKEMEIVEGKADLAKKDREKLSIEIADAQKELDERKGELEGVNREHEEEELKLRHEREKLVVRINPNDLRTYERIRNAKLGKAVVPVRRNACGGCYKRVPPQTVLELRKHDRIMTCEHCGRILVSDDIAEGVNAER